MHFETTTGLETWCTIAFVGSLFDSNSQVLTVWHCNRSLVVKEMLLCPDFFILETKFGFPIEWDISLMAPIYYIKFRNSGIVSRKGKKWIFLLYLADRYCQLFSWMADTQIPLWYSNPSGKNREKDVYMSEKSRAEENQVQTLYCNLVSGDVTWVKTSSFVFGEKGANS